MAAARSPFSSAIGRTLRLRLRLRHRPFERAPPGSSICSSYNWIFRKNCYERKYPDLSQLSNGYFIAAAHYSSSSADSHTYELQLKH
uniref:Uncharacterized protein n=1 Tax=Oryza sativa subsp. japonica TaxID=39947 RepID=Q2QQ01_ORYSJ|nr:hypothetical protein LOC_Os12g32700 [Oryza sativa Japonica Group]